MDVKKMKNKLKFYKIIFIHIIILIFCAINIFADVEMGIAINYPEDEGIKDHPSVMHATGFETPAWHINEFGATSDLKTGYEHTTDENIVLTGEGALQIQQTQGTHYPNEFYSILEETEIIYLRWYRRYEEGYDWIQHKMPGVYAKVDPMAFGGPLTKPTGYDKYSCKLYVDFDGKPAFYSYHPDQPQDWGDHFAQNIGDQIVLESERWYSFEMMIKANTPSVYDGELKMWIDGELKGHITEIKFRDTADLKINLFTHSAYVGGNWVSEQDQKLWEDNLVIATEYIGPMVEDYSGYLFVDNDIGDDSNNGSFGFPVQTISKAVELAQLGYTIHVKNTNNPYQGVCVNKNEIKIIGTHGMPTINSYVTCDGRNALFYSRADDVYFENFILDASEHDCINIRALIFSGLPDVPIYRNHAKKIYAYGPGQGCDGRSLLSSSLCYNCILEDSISKGAEEHGIYWTNHQDGSIIRNNFVTDADGACLQLNSDPETFQQGHDYQDGIMSNNLVENNILYDCGTKSSSALNLAGVHDSIFRNNLIYGNQMAGGIASWDDGYSSWGDSGNFNFGCKNNKYYHNTVDCRNCDRHAMSFRNGGTGNEFKNNIIITDEYDAIAIDSESNSENDIDYNLYLSDVFFENTNEDFISFEQWQNLGFDENSFTDVFSNIFVSDGNYNLTSQSSALDNAIEVGIEIDLEMKIRPTNNGFDIGALEFDGEQCEPITNSDLKDKLDSFLNGEINTLTLMNEISLWKNSC
jgi:hypothetical protein